ncbi:MAG TPA: PAS domain S-box protein, partial [Roseiflexaceae bacterium]|nr:PAS domain S-box protein [Roseiflexaceae bacterium]
MTLRHRLRLADPPPRWLVPIALTIALLVLLLDWMIGPGVHFPLLSVLPVLLAAWFGRRTLALSLALLLPLVRAWLELVVWQSDTTPIVLVDFLTRVVVLALLALLASALSASTRQLSMRLLGIMELAEDAIIGTDQNGTVEIWNASAERLFGYPAAEIIGRSVTLLTGPDRVEEMEQLVKRLRGGERIASYETVRQHKDGTPVEVSASFFPLRDSAGRLVGTAATIRDITERKRAEAALRESQQLYTTLFDNAPIPAALATYPGVVIVDANAAVERLIGFSKQELVGKTTLELGITRPEERERVLNAVAERGSEMNQELHIRTKSGDERIISVSVSTVQINGQTYAMATLIDITESKLATERMRQSEARFATLFHQSPIALALGSYPGGKYANVNDAFCELFGLTREQTIGRSADELGLLNSETRLKLYEMLRTGGEMRNLEVATRRANGEPLHVVSSVCFVTIDSATYSLISMVDITERKRVETALRNSEERLQFALSASNMGTFLWHPAEDRAEPDERMLALFGLPAGAALTLEAALTTLIHPEDRVPYSVAVARAIDPAGNGALDTDIRVIYPDGTEHWLTITAQTYFEGKPRRAVRMYGMAADITERKRAEEERRQFDARLQQTQKLESLGVMAGGIAHDFNNLLTGILGYADLALFELAPDSPARPLIDTVVKAGRRAAELTAQMLAYSGKGHLLVESLNLSALVEDMTQLLEISISKQCMLNYRLASDLPPVEADATQLRQVIMNLVINASEAGGE